MDIEIKKQRKDALRKSLNYAYLKAGASEEAIDKFKTQATKLLKSIQTNESEEFHKNSLSDFLKETYYKDKYYINTKGKNDLVIHNDKTAHSSVGVIIEVKRPSNKIEMVNCDNLNKKALQELVLYYLRERISHKNLHLKQLIITNINEWFIFDARVFEGCFAENKQLVKDFNEFESGTLAGHKTKSFYDDIAKPVIEVCKEQLLFTYFNLPDYQEILENSDREKDKALIPLFKVLSPEHLLKLSFSNDANSLNQEFYNELLHIIGLEEIKEGGKKLIKRKKSARNQASFLEQTINEVESLREGHNEDKLFEIAIELSITWINRILFLKLLESQLISYHHKNKDYQFLNCEKITCFTDLNRLFFHVLAVKPEQRNESAKQLFPYVPYLNSSLFEKTKLENEATDISHLSRLKMPLLSATVLKDGQGKKRSDELDILSYLFEFLDAYDFANDSKEEIKEHSKSLISASVLGLIFEKINGYKDGSFFTPSIITMYMSRETMRLAVLQKFNEEFNWQCQNFTELYNQKFDLIKANELINSLKICDPAVGSGHFLVSVLNEILAIKSELEILLDRQGKRLKYKIEVVNDELKITAVDDDVTQFEYDFNNKENQRVQEALFHEKQTLIENCLFGVDINPNSVKICRLRLWIELLKNAYYIDDGSQNRALETLPNIDINIQCGNSLISRFELNEDLKKHKAKIEIYKNSIYAYQSVTDKVEKRVVEKTLSELKNGFFKGLQDDSAEKNKLKTLSAKLDDLNHFSLFEETAKDKKEREKAIQKIESEIAKIHYEMEVIQSNKVYDNAFEWRFIFPEALNEDGDFIGFDVIIGNPPYIQIQNFSGQDIQIVLQNGGYETFERTGDIYALFIEKGISLLRKNGLLSFITSNKWMRAGYGQSLRHFLATKIQPLKLIDFGDSQLFKNATTYTNILIAQNITNHLPFYACAVENNYTPEMNLTAYFSAHSQEMPLMSDNPLVISSTIEQHIKAKIEAVGTPLKDWDITIYRGILTGFNEAFIIDTETKERLCSEDSNSEKIIKPILRGRDIKKYCAEWAGLWLINSHNNPPVKMDDYPAIKKYLDTFYSQLEKRGDKGETLYHLRSCAYLSEFKKEKIIYPNMTSFLPFCYDSEGFFTNQKCFILTGESLKYLVSFLNSTLFKFAFKNKFPELMGNTYELSKVFFDKIPVLKIPKTKQQPFIRLVNKILAAKKAGQDTHDLEAQIDSLVYTLYGLTEDEIFCVEGK
jgi:adenine-specific DNA-methyltransferase